jgi:SAM-dependent methyltransferase
VADGPWLTKGEVNGLYYSEVGGELVFGTEAQRGYHPAAVARLIAAQARVLGKDELRILELGANNGAFAGVLLQFLGELRDEGEPLRKVDYVASEWSRSALEAALVANEASGRFDRSRRAPASDDEVSLVAHLASSVWPDDSLYLLHGEAKATLRRTSGAFDVVIANELLDDLPCRAFYSDDDGTQHELVAETRRDGDGWLVRVRAAAVETPLSEMPAATLTASSDDWRAVAEGAAKALAPGGLFLVHDYGFAERFTGRGQYEDAPRSVPPFATLEFPDGSDAGFPRAFYRIFGNEEHGLIQITTDVNLAEVASVLDAHGTTIVLPHGNAILTNRGGIESDDGVFISEFALLDDDAELPAQLERLERTQAELRARYADAYLGGRTAMFSDLVFVKR